MSRPYVLIHQARPSHQILLHQAFNAQGIFDVRIIEDAVDLRACLSAGRCPDLLILDHAMPTKAGHAVLKRLAGMPALRALMFVGQAAPDQHHLALEAKQRGLWVLAELPWPLSMTHLQRALQCLGRRTQTVTSAPHAH